MRHSAPSAFVAGGDGGAVEGLLARLHTEVADRLRRAYAPKSQGPLGSALRAFARFAAACPERETLFVTPDKRGDLQASAHNEWTLILFAWYLSTTPSQKTGKPISPKSIASYVSLLKGYFNFSYGFAIVDSTQRLKRLLKELLDESPIVNRKKRRGLRRRHLIKLYEAGAGQCSKYAVNAFALISTAWHTLARGAELAPSCKPGEWTPEKGPSRADLTFHTCNAEGTRGRCKGEGTAQQTRRYAILWLRPKKKRGLAPKVPQYIEEFDGSGSDTYAALRRLVTMDPVPASEEWKTPLFRNEVRRLDGSKSIAHINVAGMRSIVRSYAKILGHTDLSQWGSHSCRIGGATDLASTGESTELLLKAKGRWASDIGAIYARLTRRQLLAASRLMQRGWGRDMEELIPSFTQPA